MKAFSICLSALLSLMIFCQPEALAQSADNQPPTIKIRYNRDVQNDGTWVLGAKVTDNVAVEFVEVFYKPESALNYSSTQYPTGNDYQWQRLPVGEQAVTVHFYIEARDASGNFVTRGSADEPLSVNLGPVTAEKLAARAAAKNVDESNEPAGKASQRSPRAGEIDFGENCVRASVFSRATVRTTLTNKANKSNGKAVPQGRVSAMRVGSGEKHYIYTKWSNLKNKEYKVHSRLFDSNNRAVVNAKTDFQSEWAAGDGNWTTWVIYTPKPTDPVGNWTFTICEGGKLQVKQTIKVVK